MDLHTGLIVGGGGVNQFDQLTAHLVDATSGPVRQAMSDAGLSGSDIAKVV